MTGKESDSGARDGGGGSVMGGGVLVIKVLKIYSIKITQKKTNLHAHVHYVRCGRE